MLPTTFTVSTTADSGTGSLRSAIAVATQDGQADTIQFAPSLAGATILLTSVGDTSFGPSAFGISTPVTIDGGRVGIAVMRSDAGAAMRIFHIASNGNLTLQNFTLEGGLALGGDGAERGGGAAGMGGAIFNDFGTLTLSGMTLMDNVAQGGNGGFGAITSAPGGGGGVDGAGSSGSQGVGGAGGGPHGGAGGSTFNPNGMNNGGNATGDGGGGGGSSGAGGAGGTGGFGGGGGGAAGGQLFAFGGGGGYGGGGGGGGLGGALGGFGGGPALGGNGGAGDANGGGGGGGGGGAGGAVFNRGGTVFITNSTLVENSAFGGSGGAGGNGGLAPAGSPGTGFGGGLYNFNGILGISDSTFSGNFGAQGADVYQDETNIASNLVLVNDILSSTSNSDVVNNFGVTDGNNNLITGVAAGVDPHIIVSRADPKLGPLQNHGGPTPTLALMADSPAIDAGTSQGVPATDQRGYPRVVNGRVDLGAYEFDSGEHGSSQLQFSLQTYSVQENGGSVWVYVTRTGSSAGTVSVQLRTVNGSALAGLDYIPVSSTLTFQDGEITKAIQIPILNQRVADGDQTFSVSLLSPTGASLGFPATTTVVIVETNRSHDISALVEMKVAKGTGAASRSRRILRVRNTSGKPLAGPLWLVLAGLSPKIKLKHKAGLTRWGPYLRLNVKVLEPLASLGVLLDFSDPMGRPFRFTPRLMAGSPLF